jgi:hypothetical protein
MTTEDEKTSTTKGDCNPAQKDMTDDTFDLLRVGYFGGCPRCGGDDGFINVRRAHFFLCEQHKTAWVIGANVFSSWRDEDEATWEKNARMLKEHYTEVEPVHNPLACCMRVDALAAQLTADRTTGAVIHCCPRYHLKAVLQCQDGRTLSISEHKYTTGQRGDINCVCTQDPSSPPSLSEGVPPLISGSADDDDLAF